MQIVEDYNEILKREEDSTIRILNKTLDRSFNRIVRRLRVWFRTGNFSNAERDIAVLNELRTLVPAANPNKTDAYDRIFRNSLQSASNNGIDVSQALVGQMSPGRPRIDVTIPIEAVTAAARQARGYLTKHGTRFAETSAEIVASGITEGRSTEKMVQEMQDRLGVVKSRGEVIVRTESLRAYNDASNNYYFANNVDYVLYYATADDRACPICAPRGGQVYKRTEITVPVHPRCRCYLAPYDPEIAQMSGGYKRAIERHQKEMEQATTIDPVNLNRAAVFEQIAPVPVSIE